MNKEFDTEETTAVLDEEVIDKKIPKKSHDPDSGLPGDDADDDLARTEKKRAKKAAILAKPKIKAEKKAAKKIAKKVAKKAAKAKIKVQKQRAKAVSTEVKDAMGPAPEELADVSHVAEAVASIAEPIRLRIAWYLSQKDATVGTLAERLKISQPAVSHHLRILEYGHVTIRERAGKHVICRFDKKGPISFKKDHVVIKFA